MYITRIESTLKGGCSAILGPRTVICGPNGIGKSTVIQALELATCGWISDLEGRDRVKLGKAIARSFPPDGPKYAECTLSTGEICRWELLNGSKKGSYKTPIHEAPRAVSWPFQELKGILCGDAATVTAWLEKHVFGALEKEEALSLLPPAIRPIVRDLMDRKRKTDFLGLAKAARSEAKSLRSEATRSEKTTNAMLTGVALPLTAAAREDLEVRIRQDQQASWSANQCTQEAYDRVLAEILDLMTEATSLEGVIHEPPPDPEALIILHRIETALSLIASHKEAMPDAHRCWVCNGEWQALRAREWAQVLGKTKADLGAVVAAQALRSETERKIKALKAAAQAKADRLKQMDVVEPREVDTTLLDRLARDKAARLAWTNADATRKEIEELRARAAILSSAATSLTAVGRNLLDQSKQGFEARVSALLPEGDVFGIDLASARVGLVRESGLHSALSGAEWSRVLLAIACALDEDSTLSVLSPEDRAWDRDTLGRMMNSLSDSKSQIIVMSTVKPLPVEGWTLVDLTEGS